MGVSNFDIVKANGYIGLPDMSSAEGVGQGAKVFYVCNSTTAGILPEGGVAGSNTNSGLSPLEPFSTIDFAVGQCADGRGDRIIAMPGHNEAVTAAAGLDLDVVGISIEFLGEGTYKAKVTFSGVVGADMDVDAAGITLIHPKFVAELDALTGPIDINAADFTIIDGEYHDGTTIDTTDCIVGDANATRARILGWKYFKGDQAGTQKQSNIQFAAAAKVELKYVNIEGDFATGCIENGTAWTDVVLENVVLDNANASPTVGMLLQATSTGTAKNVFVRVASGTTYVTANNDMQWFECFGTGTDATSGEKIGTILAGDLEAKIDVIDEYHDVPAADNVLNAQINEVIGNKTDAAASGAVTATDTLVGYTKQLVTEGIARDTAISVIDEYHDVPAADNVLNAQINEVIGNKTDAAAAGAVTGTDTLVGYTKQLVTEGIARDTAISVIDGFQDVPTADVATNAQMRDVVGNKTDAAAAGAVSEVESLMAYAKQNVTAGIAAAAELAKIDAATLAVAPVAGSIGRFIASGGTALGTQLPDSKSLYDMVRQYGEGYLVSKAYADLTGYDTAAAFTVTGDVMVKVVGVVGVTAITSTSGTTTLAVGTTELSTGIIAASTIDNSQFAATDVWVDATPTNDVEVMSSAAWNIVGGSANIILTRNVDDLTAGTLTLYCWWKPLSSDGNVVAA